MAARPNPIRRVLAPAPEQFMKEETFVNRAGSSRAVQLVALGLAAAACGKTEAPAEVAPEAPAPAEEAQAEPAAAGLKVGFIYVGPRDDFGYSQAHAEGAKAIGALPGVTLLEEEKVAETMDVQRTMESMINEEGVKVLFPTSFGYFDPHVLKVAAKHPEVTFLHCGGLYDATKHPKNVGSYFGYIDSMLVVAGKPDDTYHLTQLIEQFKIHVLCTLYGKCP